MSALLKALKGVAAGAGRGRAPLVGPTEAEAGSLSSLDTCIVFHPEAGPFHHGEHCNMESGRLLLMLERTV